MPLTLLAVRIREAFFFLMRVAVRHTYLESEACRALDCGSISSFRDLLFLRLAVVLEMEQSDLLVNAWLDL
jgi:hypothetical protein